MILLSLLIVMAIERVTTKSRRFHVATWHQCYASFLLERGWLKRDYHYRIGDTLLIALIPALASWLVIGSVPLILEFAFGILILWVCLGCPVTRNTYKRYLHSANRKDFEACSLHSMKFGNYSGELDNVGQQLVLVNYRQYASVVIFFVMTGIPGLIFYSIIKEISLQAKREEQRIEDKTAADRILFVLDWIPVRITTFGFMVVGHFSHALTAWLEVMTTASMDAYHALGKVAKSAEDISSDDIVVDEPLQLVKLVKRNVVFLLMLTALATMVGVVS